MCIDSCLHTVQYSPTYPAVIVVPSSVSDNVLKHGGSYRSKVRIPALSYLHPVNNCSITRSSQPMVGLMKNKRNPQDERLVAAIFSNSRPPASVPAPQSSSSVDLENSQEKIDMQSSKTTELAFEGQQKSAEPATLNHHRSEPDIRTAKIYGAQQRNLIIDARPFINARVNQAAGMGSENMDYYKDATINFLGIDNIHVMRDSLAKVVDAISHSDYTKLPPDQGVLTKSKWPYYIARILKGAELVARQIGVNHSHVLIHCSDGWDRTSQISALSQLCLDPYYRTIEGFIVLVEKDWLSFGHMFRRRTGPLGSEKWFEIENERVGGGREGQNGGQPAANALENAFLKAQGFFSKKNDSRETLDVDGDGTNSVESSPQQNRVSKHDPFATKPSETSPIFHQFLDATWQLLYQHPSRFEFNERFLRRLLYQLYSCQYGTFLFDNERERVEHKASQRTQSVWDYFLSRKAQFINASYEPEIDDKIVGQERLIFPDPRKVRWWPEVFGRTDEEMNGTAAAPAASLPRDDEPVVTGIESEDVAAGPAVNGSSLANLESNNPFASSAERLSNSFSSLGFSRASAPASRPRTPGSDRFKESSGDDELQTSPLGRRNELSMQTFARDSVYREAF